MSENRNKVALTINVNAPAQRVWEIISDYGNAQAYNPMIKKVTLLSSNDRGVCAKRRCELYDNSSIVEEVSLWIEEKGFTVNLTETSMPFESAKIHIRINPRDLFSSDITMEMNYAVKFGLIGWVMDRFITRRKILHMFGKTLRGLIKHLATNNYIENRKISDGVSGRNRNVRILPELNY